MNAISDAVRRGGAPAPAARVDLPHRRHRGFDRGWAPDLDSALVFAAFTATLFALELPVLTPLVFLAVPLAYAAFRWDRITRLTARCGLLLLVPLFTMLSALWSDAPKTSLYYGTEFLMTFVVAIVVGAGVAERSAAGGILAAFFLHGLLNFLVGLKLGLLGFHADQPFVGLAGSKNAAGDMAALGAMVGLAAALGAIGGRRPLGAAAGLLLVAMDLLIVAGRPLDRRDRGGPGSAGRGARLVGIAAAAVAARSVILVAILAQTAFAVATRRIWYDTLFTGLLRVSGKDATLTGRTYIWSRAQELIAMKPALGLGYSAFWLPGNLTAEAIWRKFGIANRAGFNFHNSFVEIAVQLGYVGLALFALVLIPLAILLLLRTLRAPSQLGILYCAVAGLLPTAHGRGDGRRRVRLQYAPPDRRPRLEHPARLARGGGARPADAGAAVDLTIIIPAYDRLWCLPQTIASCRGSAAAVEILVVDDGSTDGTWEWLRTQPDVRAVRQENCGKAYAVNRALELATGTYVRFLDSDDLLPPGVNDLQLAAARAHDADIVVAGYEQLYEDDGARYVRPWLDCDDFVAQQLGECDSSHYSAYLFRRAFVAGLPHRPEFAFLDDRMFVIEAALRRPRVAAVAQPCLTQRHHTHGRIQFQGGLSAAANYWQEARVYRRACRMLETRGELTPRRRRAVAGNLFALAQRTAVFSLADGRALLRWARELDPEFRMPVRRRIDRLYRWLGFTTAQRVVNLARSARDVGRRLSFANRAYLPPRPSA